MDELNRHRSLHAVRGHAVWPHDRGYTVTLRRGVGRELADFLADFALERADTRCWWLSR